MVGGHVTKEKAAGEVIAGSFQIVFFVNYLVLLSKFVGFDDSCHSRSTDTDQRLRKFTGSKPYGGKKKTNANGINETYTRPSAWHK